MLSITLDVILELLQLKMALGLELKDLKLF